MKASDIKTMITSGTVLLAVVLYLVFNQSSGESVQQNDDYTITPEIAVEATGNELLDVQFVSVNDGDTFRVKVNGKEERIRLLMIDTPEMNYDKKDPMPYAEDAKSYTANLLENASKIQLLYDVGPKTDYYGRLLTYVFVDDVLLQELLLKEGYAAVRYINEPNNTLEKEFREIEETAKASKLNIWENDRYLQKDGFHPEVIQH